MYTNYYNIYYVIIKNINFVPRSNQLCSYLFILLMIILIYGGKRVINRLGCPDKQTRPDNYRLVIIKLR